MNSGPYRPSPERSQSLLRTANNPNNVLTSNKNTQVGYISWTQQLLDPTKPHNHRSKH
jgi:hypothetical protein